MKRPNSEHSKKPMTRRRWFWLVFGVQGLFCVLAAVLMLLDKYMMERSGDALWSIIPLLAAMVVLLIGGAWSIYTSIRYLQLPTWRWMARSFQGEPDIPRPSWSTKSAMARAKKLRNRRQRIMYTLGQTCVAVSVLLIASVLFWRWTAGREAIDRWRPVCWACLLIALATTGVGSHLTKWSVPKSIRNETDSQPQEQSTQDVKGKTV